MKSKLVGSLLLLVFLISAFIGCKAEIETVQDRPVTVTYKGVIADVPANESSLYEATHFLDLEGEKVYLRSLIYDLDDRLYDGALISVSGVPRIVRGQKTLTVDRILILDANSTDSVDDESNIAGMEDGNEESFTDVKDIAKEDEPQFVNGRSDDYVLPDDYSELTSLPLGFKIAYPKNYYYAQVQNGYAFADNEVDIDDISSWKIYIQLKDNNFVALPDTWQTTSFDLHGRKVNIFYMDVDRNIIEQMLSSFDFL